MDIAPQVATGEPGCFQCRAVAYRQALHPKGERGGELERVHGTWPKLVEGAADQRLGDRLVFLLGVQPQDQPGPVPGARRLGDDSPHSPVRIVHDIGAGRVQFGPPVAVHRRVSGQRLVEHPGRRLRLPRQPVALHQGEHRVLVSDRVRPHGQGFRWTGGGDRHGRTFPCGTSAPASCASLRAPTTRPVGASVQGARPLVRVHRLPDDHDQYQGHVGIEGVRASGDEYRHGERSHPRMCAVRGMEGHVMV